jgi:hypothetical protein
MEKRILGKTGLDVGILGLGGANHERAGQEELKRIMGISRIFCVALGKTSITLNPCFSNVSLSFTPLNVSGFIVGRRGQKPRIPFFRSNLSACRDISYLLHLTIIVCTAFAFGE